MPVRRATAILGYGIIGLVLLMTGCVSAGVAALLALQIDERISSNEPIQRTVLTIERLKGTVDFLDGTGAFVFEGRDESGQLVDVQTPFESSAGDRVGIRYRRSRIFRLRRPVELFKCVEDEPC